MAEAFGVTERGNWEGRTILACGPCRTVTLARQARLRRRGRRPRLARARGALLAAREPAAPAGPRRQGARRLERAHARRVRRRCRAPRPVAGPGRWPPPAARYRSIARARGGPAARGALRGARRAAPAVVEGRPGASTPATLEDHAAPGRRAAGPPRGDPGRALVPSPPGPWPTTVLARFADPAGGFFDTPDDGEPLVVRPRALQDNALPSGSAMAATVLLRLAALTGEGRYAGRGGAALARRGRGRRAAPDGLRPVARRDRLRPRPGRRGRDRRRPGGPRPWRPPRRRCAPRLPAAPGGRRRARTRRPARCRSSRAASRSAGCRPRSSAATSPAASR